MPDEPKQSIRFTPETILPPVETTPPPPVSTTNPILRAIEADPSVQMVIGGAKKAITGIPLTVSKWMGMVPSTTTPGELGAEPTTGLQKLGGFGEQAAEFMLPERLIGGAPTLFAGAGRLARLANLGVRGAVEGAGAGTIAGLQGGDPTLPAAIGAASPFAGALAGRVATKLYRSQLKPSTTLTPQEAQAVVETGLREGILPTPGGGRKLERLTGQLGQDVGSQIEPTATISPTAVVQRAGTTRPRLETQVNPEAELQTFDEAMNEFLRQHQTPAQPAIYGRRPAIPAQDIPIPAPRAQALKTGTYQRTYERTGEQGLTAASKMGQTALARGLKEELEAQFPQIGPLNERLGELYRLREQLTPAMNRIANRDIIPISMNPLALLERLPVKAPFALALERARRIPGALAAGGISQVGRGTGPY
jgi:hypothetical protein